MCIRDSSSAAICVALSFALSYLKLWEMPQGGSVTFASLLPLMIYSYMFGTKKGVFAGLIYGVLQAVQDPWIIHPAQFLLDYPVAFAAIGVTGMFANMQKLEKLPQVQFALGAIVASVLRFVSHVLSGVFAFSAYAADAGMNVWAYSTAYNSFVFVDVALVIVAGVLAFSSPSLVKQARKFRIVEKKPKGEVQETPENALDN
ncbi:MAG: energy-coupled thiamine transporter ThiT, partial [Clostridiales bacterium]|nr:energy-coupled thiamine transporter ThiT [Clostridiales bacterium]